jgi:glycosyltransferase involved in cell wall biosynthesis
MIHIMHVMIALGRGGAERVLADIVSRTDPGRFRHTIVYLHEPHDLASELVAAGCDVVCLDAPTRHGWTVAWRPLRRLIRERAPDILQSSMFGPNLALRIASLGLRLPLVTWLVSMEYDPGTVLAAGWSRANNLVRRSLDRITARLAATRYVACSNSVLASAKRDLAIPASKIEVIYNPVSLAGIDATQAEARSLRNALGIEQNAFVYLMIGRLDAQKNQRQLLEAFAQRLGENRDEHLIVVGLGRLEQELKALASNLGLRGHVHFTHSIPRTGPYFAAADVFVFPSLVEGLPVAVLEAMSASLPVIASDIPPHLEVLRDGQTGMIVPRGSVAHLAQAMDAMRKDDELRRTMSKAARDEAVSRFSTDVIVPQWEAVYERLAAPSRSPA